MQALEAHDREQALRLNPAEKLMQALEVMRAGIRLKRSALRQRFPDADEADIESRLGEWLRSDG